mgnify:CR=1 FL=1
MANNRLQYWCMKHLSGIRGWIKQLIIFSTGVIQRRPIWKTDAAALPCAFAYTISNKIGKGEQCMRETVADFMSCHQTALMSCL